MVEPPALRKLGESATPNEALETVVRNYGLYHEVAARLRTLQAWARGALGQKVH